MVHAEGRYLEAGAVAGDGASGSGVEKRTAIFIGPEFGTVTRPDLVSAAKEAGDSDFEVLIACAFNYEAHATEFSKLGRIQVPKARMNADLHMADDLKNTGKGNLFVIFGEPDIDILPAEDGRVRVKVNGADVFHPSTGEVRLMGRGRQSYSLSLRHARLVVNSAHTLAMFVIETWDARKAAEATPTPA